MLSFWERNTFFSKIDVAIVGSGIVGLTAAINLKKYNSKLNVVILERGFLPWGGSTKNAGFSCFGSPSELLDDLQSHTEEEVQQLIERRWKGLLELRSLLGDDNIGYEPLGNYEVFGNADIDLYNQCADKLPYLNSLVKDIIGKPDVYIPADGDIAKNGLGNTSHLILNTAEGQIDTGLMMKNLLSLAQSLGVVCFNGFTVDRVEETGNGYTIIGDNKQVSFTASKVIIANNAFAAKLFPGIDIKPARAQVLITKPVDGLKLKGAFHADMGYYYFRNVGSRILFGGGRNLNFKAEETFADGLTDLVQQRLDEMLSTIIAPYTTVEVDQRWSGFMAMGTKKSYITERKAQGLVLAVRCGGMGVAIGSLTGKQAAALIIEEF
ncbi:MAG: FAD-binding oxidoreductase [Sphingobacteriales bacterium JAD_PAG50586_3]|nr:MAG: FAD-binding oxidoreductase [Sphingobacteriales bacterium JAD_PAG50586_3]